MNPEPANVLVALAVLLAALTLSAPAADRWAVLTDDGARMASALEVSADGAGITVRQSDGTAAALPLRSVAAVMRRGPAPAPRATRGFFAERSTGDRILADSLELAGGKLALSNALWGRVEFPLSSVRRLIASDARLPPAAASFTGVRYANGDALPGNVVSLSSGGCTVDMPGIGKAPVDGWEAVSEVVLNSGGEQVSTSGVSEVFLRSGESLCGALAGGSDWCLKLKTDWAATPVTIPFEMLLSVAFPEGRSPLSLLPLKSDSAQPFLGYHCPATRDHALTGGPLTVDGFSAGRGWALYAGTRLDFALPSAPAGVKLIALAGIDDSVASGMGSAELVIAVDGQVAQSARLEAGGGLVPVAVLAPSNAVGVSIGAAFGAAGPAGAHVDVLFPCFVTNRGEAPR